MRVTSSRIVYENRWLRVHEDRTELADGSAGLYGWVEKRPATLVVPVADDGSVWLVEQWRHVLGARFWEFPQGSVEAGELDPESLARTELAEETGLRAGRLEPLGRLFFAYGVSNQPVDIWRASDLVEGEQALEPTEQGLVARAFAFAEVDRMVRENELRDAASVAAWHLATR